MNRKWKTLTSSAVAMATILGNGNFSVFDIMVSFNIIIIMHYIVIQRRLSLVFNNLIIIMISHIKNT